MRSTYKCLCLAVLFCVVSQLTVTGQELTAKSRNSAIEAIRSNYTKSEIPDNPQLVKWAERSAAFVDNRNSIEGLLARNIKRGAGEHKVNNVEQLVISGDIIILDPGVELKADEIITRSTGDINIGPGTSLVADVTKIETGGSISSFDPISLGNRGRISYGGQIYSSATSQTSIRGNMNYSSAVFSGSISISSSVSIKGSNEGISDMRWYISDRIEKRRASLDEFIEGSAVVDGKESVLRIVGEQG